MANQSIRHVLGSLLIVALVATACASETSSDNRPSTFSGSASRSPTEAQPTLFTDRTGPNEPLLRFITIPDFLNSDIDMTGVIPGGSPPELLEVVNFTMDAIERENPDFVLVAGDLFNSRWHLDHTETFLFGPINSLEDKQTAMRTAAETYYAGWQELFDTRGLEVYPAVGDHELGDNNWERSHDKSRLVRDYRTNFAELLLSNAQGGRQFEGTLFNGTATARPTGGQWADTAYAVVFANTLVVTLDVFSQDDPDKVLQERTGTVLATVEAEQLEWLRTLFEAATASSTVDHIVVQGHTPILAPVRMRNTSKLFLEDRDGDLGRDTAVWQLFEEFDVALYLTGEVHDITHSVAGGVHQIVNGSVIGLNPRVNYVVGEVWDDRIELTAKEIRVVNVEGATLWSTSGALTWVTRLRNSARENGFVEVGSLTIRRAASGYATAEGEGMLECFGSCEQE